MFDHTIAYYDNWFFFVVSIPIFLVFENFWTIAYIWNFIFLINPHMFSSNPHMFSYNNDDDDGLLCCNCNISLNLATWSNNNLIISSLDFNYFHRKYTFSRTRAVDILESSVWESTSFSNKSNYLSLNTLTSVKNVFFFN